jgi:hypothetical protein
VRFGRATLSALLALMVWPPAPSLAHEERSLHALTVLHRVAPPVEGLDIRVVHLGAPAMAVNNRTEARLTVLGADGEPFLRIGPHGVHANVRSPTAYRSVDPQGDRVPERADPEATPRWVRFSTSSSWTWFDPRLAYGPGQQVWNIPMLLPGREVEATGGFEPLNGHGHFLAEIDAPRIEGLEVRLAQGPIPAVFVRNSTDETLHVPGAAGEPFLQIGPRGVSANLRSPDYYTAGTQTIRKVPAWADSAAPPRWKRLSSQPVWAWLEYRGAPSADLEQRSALGTERGPILEWTSLLRLGDRELSLTGRLLWVPPSSAHASSSSSGHDLPLRVAALGLLVAVAAGFVLLSQRKRVPVT